MPISSISLREGGELKDISDPPNRITQYYAYEYLQRYTEAVSRWLQFMEFAAVLMMGKGVRAPGKFFYYARFCHIPCGCIAHIQKCINYGLRYEGESDDGIQKPFKWLCPYFMGIDGVGGLLLFGIEGVGVPLPAHLITICKRLKHRVHWWGHLCAFGLMVTGAANDVYSAKTYKARDKKDEEALSKKLAKRQRRSKKWAASGVAHFLECVSELCPSGLGHDGLHCASRFVASGKSVYEVYHHDVRHLWKG